MIMHEYVEMNRVSICYMRVCKNSGGVTIDVHPCNEVRIIACFQIACKHILMHFTFLTRPRTTACNFSGNQIVTKNILLHTQYMEQLCI